MARQKPVISPIGTAGWVCVAKPSVKFDKDGEYSLDLVISPEEYEALKPAWEAAAKAKHEEALKAETNKVKAAAIRKFDIHIPGSPEVNKEGEETGNILLKFKAKALVKPKAGKPFTKTIGVFDAKGKPMNGKTLGRGSRLKAAYDLVPFCAPGLKKYGVSLRLQAVQVIEFVAYIGGASAEGYGFGEEDGYSYEEPTEGQVEGTEGGEAPAGDSNGGDF